MTTLVLNLYWADHSAWQIPRFSSVAVLLEVSHAESQYVRDSLIYLPVSVYCRWGFYCLNCNGGWSATWEQWVYVRLTTCFSEWTEFTYRTNKLTDSNNKEKACLLNEVAFILDMGGTGRCWSRDWDRLAYLYFILI